MNERSRRQSLVSAALGMLLVSSACAVGPTYRRPEVPAPATFKEDLPPGWKDAQPNDGTPRGAWWTAYQRPAARRARRSSAHFEPERAGRRGAVSRGRGIRARCPSGPIPRCQRLGGGVAHGWTGRRDGTQSVHASRLT